MHGCGKMQHGVALYQRPALFLIKAGARGGIGAVRGPDGVLRPRRRERNGKREQRNGGRAFDDTHAASESPIQAPDRWASTRWHRSTPPTAALASEWSMIFPEDPLHPFPDNALGVGQ
jgi:hypothetical protein